ELAAAFPSLAAGAWVDPLTGKEKNFSPGPSAAPATPATPAAPNPTDSASVAGNAATPTVVEPEGVATVATIAADHAKKVSLDITDPENLKQVGAHLSEASVLGLDLET